ncbi:MAG TPA: copper amine oxidase N-terminal domain-containing protein [Bacillus bacterium]|nr:copper amine oxidase N-terminal domain-containing protein [Bacillus sp. (in: firmicutes)]
MKKSFSILLVFLTFFLFPLLPKAAEQNELVLLMDTDQMYNNGILINGQHKTIVKDEAIYVPAKSVINELGATLVFDAQTKSYVATKGDATLTFTNNETTYNINNVPLTTKQAVAIIENDVTYVQAAVLTAAFGQSFSIKDQNKVVIFYESIVELPVPVNNPPVAKFETNKDSYKIGEPIEYTDLSTDDKGIVDKIWINKEPAFFSAGEKSITLQVKDQEGLMGFYTKKITIEPEVMYTEREFGLKFTPIGDKIKFLGSEVVNYPNIEVDDEKEGGAPLIRVNSPERITGELIHYTQTLQGTNHFTIHKQNILPTKINLHFVAHNPTEEVATIHVSKLGVGGPALYLYQIGKAAVGNYLLAVQNPNSYEIVLQPGETKSLLPAKYQSLAPGYSMTVYTDVESNVPVTYTVASLNVDKTIEDIPMLPIAERDGSHNRGIFTYSEKEKTIHRVVGEKEERLIIGDGTIDTYQHGYDDLSKEEQINKGNRGVLYTVNFQKVAPNTTVVVNARGGQYAGSFLVNGRVIQAVENGLLTNPSEGAILFRTGAQQVPVTIQFIPASGSNLPLNFLFLKDNATDDSKKE